MTTTSTLASALAFARRGYAVFPVTWPIEHRGRLVCSCGSDSRGKPCTKPAKHPLARLAPNGVLSATTDEDQIARWFSGAPQANLGVHCAGLIVIDVDPRDGGDESLRALEAEHGEMPPTWRAITGSGGEHIFFVCPDGVEAKNIVAKLEKTPPLGIGIDVRTRGGYIVAPPSRHISGNVYAWSVDHHPAETPLAVAPDWLVARLTTARTIASPKTHPGTPIEPTPSDAWAKLTREPITAYHDVAAIKIAGHFFRHNCDYQLVLGMLHAWNSAWCKPPLGYHELERIVGRIATREAVRIEQELAR
jgi:hypothetical protein